MTVALDRRWTTALVTMTALALSAMLAVLPPLRAQDAEPAESADRATFNVQLPAARGGGRIEGFAGDFEFQEDSHFLATGGVRLVYQDLQLQAETARLDIPNNLLTAEGDVVLDEGQKRLIGQSLEYNLTTRTGRVTDATAYIDTTFFFTGTQIEKLGPDTYRFDDGTFTSCSEDNPPWQIAAGRATVTLGEYAHISNARMKIKGVPILYVPRMVWPAKTDRVSGFLTPHPGFSDRRGVELSLAYYKTLGRSADTTFFFDLSTEGFFGLGNEVRYKPSEGTEGYFEGLILQDPVISDFDFGALVGAPPPEGFDPVNPNDERLIPDDVRWKLKWYHETQNFKGFRAVINFEDYSDPTFRQDFERQVQRQTNNFIFSEAYLSRNSGNQSLNLRIDQRERISRTRNFFNNSGKGDENDPIRGGEITDTRRQLPEIEYRLRPTQLGGAPAYFTVDANLHYLSFENAQVSRRDANGRLEAEEYGRADLFPSFSFPLSTVPWFSIRLDLGGRVTHYTNTLIGAEDIAENPELADDRGKFNPSDDALTRTFAVAGAELVGPSFSRIYDKKKPGRFSKIKHVVEPRIVYNFLENLEDDDLFDDRDEVPLFDEVDGRRMRNESTVGLINRLIAKPSDESEGGAFEVLSLTFEQPVTFSGDALQSRNVTIPVLDPETGETMEITETLERKEGPVRTILRFNPTQATSLKAETRYNTLFNDFQSFSFSGGVKVGRHGFGGSLFANRNLQRDTTTSNQLRVFTNLWLLPNKLSLDANLSFDLNGGPTVANPLQQRYFINYQSCCYSLQFELRESQFGDIEDRDFRFSFTLKSVGTFIDLNGSL